MDARRRSAPLSSRIRLDTEQQLHTRVAWYYFNGNLTQQEIADRLGTSRVRVNRLLAACREKGLVQVTIHGELAACDALEHGLVERYGVEDALVVPTPSGSVAVRDVVGVGGGTYISRLMTDQMTVAVGWGRTMRSILRAMPSRPLNGVSVVCLQGGLSHCSGINTFEIVSDFADLYGADQHFFAAPIFASDERARDVILEQDAIRETFDKARGADLAVITVGEMTESLIMTYGVEDADDRATIVEAGAVADVVGNFIDADGRLVDHPLNRRTVALSLDDLRGIRRVVLVAGGSHRIEAMRAILRSGIPDVVITDEGSAEALTTC